MAAAPTSPITWTAIPATNPLVGPDLAYSVQSSGTLLCAPNAPGSFVTTGTELTPGATVTWVEIASATATMGPILFGSLDTTVAAYFCGGRLQIVEGA
jgi:hypothetical protein